jgi:hypothetical protein
MSLRSTVFVVAAAALALSGLIGCSSYQVVSTTPSGGVVTLEGADESAREDAEAYMGERCPFGYVVVDRKSATPSAPRSSRLAYKCKTPPAGEATTSARKEVAIRF